MRYYKYILFCIVCMWVTNSFANEWESEPDNVRTLYEDSIWHNNVTGKKVHLQRLGGVDTLVIIKPNALKALVKDFAINGTVLAWDYYIQNREYARISNKVLEDHFTHKPVFDNDSFSGNQFSHPYHGGMCFNAARNEGLSYGVSLLYPLVGSATWEFLCETNAPAVNDMLSTGIGGAVVGEVSNRVSDIFFDDSKWGISRIFRELIGGFINPVRGVHRLFSGEMWRRSASRGKRLQPQPYSFEMGVGYRGMEELKGNRDHLDIPYVELNFNYGDRFTPSGKSKPFDYFNVYLLANLDDNSPSVGDLDIIGRLADKQYEHTKDWKLDIGFYQSMKYVDHYSKGTIDAHNFSLINEAVSFGGGLYAEHETQKVCFLNDFILSCVAFGGTNADYYPNRRYNYASGLSIRNNTQFYINHKALFGNKLYSALMFSFKGYSPKRLQELHDTKIEPNCWGDQGNHCYLTNTTFIQYNVIKNVRLDLEYQIYLRNSHYRYYPSVTAKSHEWKVGLIYSI